MSDEKPTSALIIPADVQEILKNLSPSSRKRISLHDIQVIRRLYLQRAEQAEAALANERERIRAIISEVQCPVVGVTMLCGDCNCWKSEVLK